MSTENDKKIKEGKVSKGGRNPKTKKPRPSTPPQGQGSNTTTGSSEKKKT